jgi:hypothetical protein
MRIFLLLLFLIGLPVGVVLFLLGVAHWGTDEVPNSYKQRNNQ